LILSYLVIAEIFFLPKGGDRCRKTFKVTSLQLKLLSKELASPSRSGFGPKLDL